MGDIPQSVPAGFRRGVVIPAMPLALTEDRRFDKRHQRALIRYYIEAGAGGIAAGVHSTQFEIRSPEVGLYEPVLGLTSETVDQYGPKVGDGFVKIAGVSGTTRQATREAELAMGLGYHACLISLSALADSTNAELLTHCAALAEITPIIGFYLQPAVGGRILSYEFWREFSKIDNVIGIKIAPFNRYQTLDVVRGVCDAGKATEITLYTGNDDNIVIDLLTEYRFGKGDNERTIRIRGGLLGHWGFWTKSAVAFLERVRMIMESGAAIPPDLLTLAAQITDVNAAVFDPSHGFSGCISGIHEILRRQGLLKGNWCLSSSENLSPGQYEEISRVCAAYPHLSDDEFVRENIQRWLNE